MNVALLARQIARAARQYGREALFDREMRRPDMRLALELLDNSARTRPSMEHAVSVERGTAAGVLGDNPTSVEFFPMQMPGGKDATFAHTHPRQYGQREAELGADEVPLSSADIENAARVPTRDGRGYGRFAAIVADADGIANAGSIILPGPLREMSTSKYKEITDSIIRGAEAGGIANGGAWQQEALLRALARLDLVKHGGRFGPRTKQLMRRYDRAMMAAEDAVVEAAHKAVFGVPRSYMRPAHRRALRRALYASLAAGGGGAALGAYASGRSNRSRKRRRNAAPI